MRTQPQGAKPDLFGVGDLFPEGFAYRPEFLSPEEERALVARFADLPFRPFEFQGYIGNRRVVSYGWRYDFNTRELQRAEEIPTFLDPIRSRCAAFGLPASELQHVLLTEYAPGAGIGWHKDKAVFGSVIGISLLSGCTFRLRRKEGASWRRASVFAEPRSAYLLTGPARTEWEHSIPAVENLRYSITFRSMRSQPSGSG